jgi:hypothetical protein
VAAGVRMDRVGSLLPRLGFIEFVPLLGVIFIFSFVVLEPQLLNWPGIEVLEKGFIVAK